MSFIGSFIAFFNDIDTDDSIKFMSQLCSGKGVANDTINNLRMRLVNEKVSVNKLNLTTKQALIIKSWNAFRKDQVLKVLKFTPSTDSFPKAI